MSTPADSLGATGKLSIATDDLPRTGSGYPSAETRKLRGAFYTPPNLAQAMVCRAYQIAQFPTAIEPSAGDGIFCQALLDQPGCRHLHAIELDEATAIKLRLRFRPLPRSSSPSNCSLQVIQADYLSTKLNADLVIGNPPFVRLSKLTPLLRRRALETLQAADLGDPSASSWLAFVCHALEQVRPGGMLSLVLPWEASYVRYARKLWHLLGNSFGSIDVARIRQRVFEQINQDIIILQASERGHSTGMVRFSCYENVNKFAADRAIHRNLLPLSALETGKRLFTLGLLPPHDFTFVQTAISHLTEPLCKYASFHIGYVSGNRQFFHPSPAQQKRFDLPKSSLRRTLLNFSMIKEGGLYTAQIKNHSYLWHPAQPGMADQEYIRFGEESGVSAGFKCRHRTPWWKVPGVEVPDFVLSTFATEPLLMINDGKFVASNSLLLGRLHRGNHAQFVSRWYSALTRLSIELEVHSLGGGVLVLIPGEVSRLRVPKQVNSRVFSDQEDTLPSAVSTSSPSSSVVSSSFTQPNCAEKSLTRIDRELRAGNIEGAFHQGDCDLAGQIATSEVQRLWDCIDQLRGWRSRKYGSHPKRNYQFSTCPVLTPDL